MQNKSVCAIIVAAGNGSRMKCKITKQRIKIGTLSVLKRTALAFENCSVINSIVVVAKSSEVDYVTEELADIKKLIRVVVGGEYRAMSVKNGFSAVPANTDFVAVHDAARCLITPEMIEKVVTAAFSRGAASASSYVYDTVKEVDCSSRVVSTLNRANLRLASTPQVFMYSIYDKALSEVDNLSEITDDNMLVEKSGIDVYCVDIGSENIKITTKEDLLLAEFILSRRNEI